MENFRFILGVITFWGLPIIVLLSLIDVIASKELKRLLYVFFGIVAWLVIHGLQLECFICPHGSCGCNSNKYLTLKIVGAIVTCVYLFTVVKLINKESTEIINESNS